MNVELDWPPEVVDRLTGEARKKGLSLADYLLDAVLQRDSKSGNSDETEKHRKREEAGRSIRELRKGNILGPGLTARDLIEEGRRF